MSKIRSITVAALLLTGGLAHAQLIPVYSQNFEGTAPLPEWGSSLTLTSGGTTFTKFNGRYSSGSTTLSLAGLPTPRSNSVPPPGDGGSGGGGSGGSGGGGYPVSYRIHVAFDLYAIDSWDGDRLLSSDNSVVVGPDYFKVTANASLLMNETISNVTGRSQTLRTPDVGPSYLGFRSDFKDSIYRDLRLSFEVQPGQAIQITWHDGDLQGLNDESWGIDNVNITAEIIPAPGALAPLALASVAGLRRRRR